MMKQRRMSKNIPGAKDISGPFSSVNPPISVAAQKPLSYDMNSRSILPTKTPSFVSSNFYPPMSLNAPASFGGVINSKAVASSLSGDYPPLYFGAPNPFSSLDNLLKSNTK